MPLNRPIFPGLDAQAPAFAVPPAAEPVAVSTAANAMPAASSKKSFLKVSPLSRFTIEYLAASISRLAREVKLKKDRSEPACFSLDSDFCWCWQKRWQQLEPVH